MRARRKLLNFNRVAAALAILLVLPRQFYSRATYPAALCLDPEIWALKVLRHTTRKHELPMSERLRERNPQYVRYWYAMLHVVARQCNSDGTFNLDAIGSVRSPHYSIWDHRPTRRYYYTAFAPVVLKLNVAD
ncbi:hypothetical protein C8R44DRAFT_730597 [Mycena epipterygia]|nr:hypothetical protein C8R44DRAFT_730597 [Mycena epipterygia]